MQDPAFKCGDGTVSRLEGADLFRENVRTLGCWHLNYSGPAADGAVVQVDVTLSAAEAVIVSNSGLISLAYLSFSIYLCSRSIRFHTVI